MTVDELHASQCVAGLVRLQIHCATASQRGQEKTQRELLRLPPHIGGVPTIVPFGPRPVRENVLFVTTMSVAAITEIPWR